MGKSLCMKICFLFQILVTFSELQIPLGDKYSSNENKIKWDLYLAILKTLKNLHAALGEVWGGGRANEHLTWLHNGFYFSESLWGFCVHFQPHLQY